MKHFFEIKEIQTKKSGIVSRQHFGFDPGKKCIRWHGIFCSYDWNDNFEDVLSYFKEVEKEHFLCIKFPWSAKVRKDLYELI